MKSLLGERRGGSDFIWSRRLKISSWAVRFHLRKISFGSLHSRVPVFKNAKCCFNLLCGRGLIILMYYLTYETIKLSGRKLRRINLMKKYKTLATKWLAILSLTCFFILISGVILMVLHFRNVSLQICLMTLGGMLCFLFSICYFAEKNRTLTIDSNTVVFPSGATVNGKRTFKKRL